MIGTISIKIFSRNSGFILLLLPSIMLITIPITQGQAQKTNRTSTVKTKTAQQTKQATNKTVNLAGWKTVRIGKWGIKSLTLPARITEKPESTELLKINGVSSTSYSRIWESAPGSTILPSFRISIGVTTLDVDFYQAKEGLKQEEATPEKLLALDHLEDIKIKTEGIIPLEETDYLELDGLRGIFARIAHVTNKKLVRVQWHSYRYHENKAQAISVFTIGERSDLPEIMKILKSVKFH
jgi:hypothetical protein